MGLGTRKCNGPHILSSARRPGGERELRRPTSGRGRRGGAEEGAVVIVVIIVVVCSRGMRVDGGLHARGFFWVG